MSPQHHEALCVEIHETNHFMEGLASRKQLECRKIGEKYKEMYGEELVHLLENRTRSHKDETRISGEACAGLCMLVLNPHERDAITAKEALDQQSGVNYKALIEVFVGRKSSHIVLIQQAYQKKFKRQLDHDIISIEPSHPYKRILMALAASHKSHHADVSQHIAKCDAQRLYQTGEGRLGALDEAVVLEILSKRSIAQFKLAFSCYKKIYGHDYAKSLKNENPGGFEDAFKEVVSHICNPSKYYAKALYASTQGTSMDKRALARVMVSRAEIDLDQIQSIFKQKYGIKLKDAISESTLPEDYKVFLIALANKTDTDTSCK
ncbi:hypothetical protein ACET3Z_009236 [Daucus carota]